MRNLLRAAFAVAALSPAAVASAAPPPVGKPHSPEEVQREFNRLGEWLQRINEALAPADAGVSDLGNKMQALLGNGADPATLRSNSARIRVLIREARDQVLRSQAALAAIQPLQSPLADANGLNPAKMLSDVRAQTDAMLQYMNDCDVFAAAIEKNDVPAIRLNAPKMIRGGAVLLDSRVLIYRNRQSAIASDRSAHRALGVIVNLYQAMSVALHSWIRARVDGKPAEAAGDLHSQFLTLALETDTIVRQGRAIAAHEKSAIEAESARTRDNQAARDVDARAAGVVANEEKIFAIGEQLAVWLRSHAALTAEQLAAQTKPELLQALVPVEEQLVAATRAQAEMIAKPRE